MVNVAMRTAATGLESQGRRIDVIANNLANVNTVSFKSSRANFEDLFYQNIAQPGVQTGDGPTRAVGTQVGLGTRVSSTSRNFQQGNALLTEQPFDVMIEGNGFFRVQAPEGTNGGEAYTRAGNFTLNSAGEIVLQNADGMRLEPVIEVPQEAIAVTITADGRVLALQPNGVDQDEVGQIQLHGFFNPQGLMAQGNNIYVPTEASGPAIPGEPGGAEGLGSLRQGVLEASNVSPTQELIQLIESQRAFEMNSQVIDAADGALQVVANLGR